VLCFERGTIRFAVDVDRSRRLESTTTLTINKIGLQFKTRVSGERRAISAIREEGRVEQREGNEESGEESGDTKIGQFLDIFM